MESFEAKQPLNRPHSSDAGILRPQRNQVALNSLAARSRGTTEIEAQHATEPRSADHATGSMSDRLGWIDELITDAVWFVVCNEMISHSRG